MLTVDKGLSRDSVNAPIAACFALAPMVGAFLGPLLTGVAVDRFGIASTGTMVGALHLFSGVLVVIALWPFRRLTVLGSDSTGATVAQNEPAVTKVK